MKLIYKVLEKGFLKYLEDKQRKKLDEKNLQFEFVDNDGLKYYSFTKDTLLPIGRLAKLQEFVLWLQKGVDIEDYKKLLDAADKALTDGLMNKKGASKIGFVIAELRDRCNMVLHHELFYNFIAVQLVRSDESVADFDNDKHMQKVIKLKEMNEKEQGFFLIIQKYLKALTSSDITKNELEELLRLSMTKEQATAQILSSL